MTSAAFTALADDTRRSLLETLVHAGSALSATALAAPLPVSRQAVERHLKVLERAGLVTSTKSGREVLFAIRRDELDRLAQWLVDLGDSWDRRLRSVKVRAEARERRDRS